MRVVKKTKIPRDAKTFEMVCDLPRSHRSSGYYHMYIDDKDVAVSHEPLSDITSVNMIRMPRRHFHKLIDWYNGATK